MNTIQTLMLDLDATQTAYALGYCTAEDLSEMLNLAAVAITQLQIDLDVTTYDLIEAYETMEL